MAWQVLQRTVTITAFVAVMMIAVEYANVVTRGSWQIALRRSRWVQYPIAAVLGAIPGCLGAFTVVALYTHRVVSLGALTACMIATSGDEAFVMFALFPGRAMLLTLGMAIIAVIAGILTDLPTTSRPEQEDCIGLVVHDATDCRCTSRDMVAQQLRHPSRVRGLLATALGVFLLALVTGRVGSNEWNWVRFSICAVCGFGLFVVLTVPEHFLERHVWRHTVRQHVPRLFAWTLGAMILMQLIESTVHVETFISGNPWGVLVTAALLGIVPESGPHLLFVILYDSGTVPLSVLAASSIVQDGHGALPLLAYSRIDFLRVKGVNLSAGLVVGALLMAAGS